MSTTSIDDKGRIRLPSSIRNVLKLRSGDQLSIEIADDAINLKIIKPDASKDPMFKDFFNPTHVQPKLAKKKILESLEAELWQGSS